MRDNLDDALKLMFGHEGGYVNDQDDPGGPTKFGITQKTLSAYRGRNVTAAEVKAMTLAEAEEIYRRSYWTQAGGDLLPAGADYVTFDFGVNSGPAQAVKTLQRVDRMARTVRETGVAIEVVQKGATVRIMPPQGLPMDGRARNASGHVEAKRRARHG